LERDFRTEKKVKRGLTKTGLGLEELGKKDFHLTIFIHAVPPPEYED
jgi:hypothetical protein